MNDFLSRINNRKLVQWTLAYLAGGWLVLQVADLAISSYHWPGWVMRVLFAALLLGLVVTWLLAWYHGEQGRQRTSGIELLLLTGVFAIGGFLIWHFALPHASRDSHASKAVAAAASSPMPAASAAVAASPVVPAKSIAVLPFENLSTDKANAYFADGMQDLILTKLADIGELKVISRTSTMQYGSHPENLKTVGRQLGVATVLEGSVQKAGDQVLINVQLIDTRSDSHLWAQSYQRTLSNIFGVEGEVATKIAHALQARLTARESAAVARVPTRNPKAYDAYLRGQTYFSQVRAGQVERLPAMVAAYKVAVQQDPKFALAWADLALGQSFRVYFGQAGTASMRKQALANAKHALALEPDLPQAHFALGYVYRFDFADYRRALAQFEIARRGLPNDAMVEAAIGYIHAYQGHIALEAVDLRRAAELNPRDPNVIYSYASALANLRRYDESRAVLHHLLAIAPDDPEAYASLAQVDLLQHGDVQAAMRWLDQAPADVQSKPSMIRQRLSVLLIQHDAAAARRLMGQLKPGGRLFGPIDVLDLQSLVALQIGDRAQAQALARKVVAMAGRLLAGPASESTPDVYWRLAIAQAILGQRASAMQSVQRLRTFLVDHIGEEHVTYGTAAMTQVGTILGDHGSAIEGLRVQLDQPYGLHISVPLLKIDPFWDPLRGDPRFRKLLLEYAHPDAAPADAGTG